MLLAVTLAQGQQATGQAFFGRQRPFVVAITPIVGPGGVVGGIYVDAEGLVSRVDIDATGGLGQLQPQALSPVASDVSQPSSLRKISLRKLEQELVRLREGNLPLSAEIEFLAGLQRIEYIFVDADSHDIILAGPAEGWRVGDLGFVVGQASGLPVIHLSDLVMTLRSGAGESADGITCSMDATPEGIKNYTDYINTDPPLNEQTLREMARAIGNFQVTFTGVASHSHYARTLIAADLMMKRLAMNLEPSPVRGINSYMEVLQKTTRRFPQNSSPRWWLASDYETVLRDEEGLAWQINGPGVKAMTSQDFLNQHGVRVDTRDVNPLAQRWADDFTEHYEDLSVELPVFGQLRNCMDLAVIAALLHKYELFRKAGLESTILLDAEQIQLAEYPVPRFTPPQISYARGRRSWIVTVSGGIAIDGWSVASVAQVDVDLQGLHQQVVDSSGESWWWD